MNITLDFKDYFWNMQIALEEGINAYYNDEVPIGACIISNDGRLLSRAKNNKEKMNDPCGHAEILAIRDACQKNNNWRLNGAIIFVTLEPCPMCLSAILQTRIEKLIFGAYDLKGGAISLGYHFHKDKRLNHSFKIIGGMMHYECSKILSQFFREKRSKYKAVPKK